MAFLSKYKMVIINILMLIGMAVLLLAPDNKYESIKSFFGGFIFVGMLYNIFESIKLTKGK